MKLQDYKVPPAQGSTHNYKIPLFADMQPEEERKSLLAKFTKSNLKLSKQIEAD